MITLTVPILIGLISTGISGSYYEADKRDSHHKVKTGSIVEAHRPKRRRPSEEDNKYTQDNDRKRAWADAGRGRAIVMPPRGHEQLRIATRRLSTTDTTNALVIHLPPQEEESVDMSVVDLRGHMEAQDIDERSRKSWCDQLMAICSGSRKRQDPLAPPPLARQYSYYPGQILSPATGSEPLSPESDRSDYVTKDEQR